eukprot:gene13317-biopygen10624
MPEILSRRDKDGFLRKFKTMRESNPNVHVMEVAKECDITEALKDTSPTYWTEDVLLYLDAVSFVHKSNPYEDALSPAGRVWRKLGEGLKITAKGSKDLPSGRDNDPSQNSAMARDAMKNTGAEVVKIPPSFY